MRAGEGVPEIRGPHRTRRPGRHPDRTPQGGILTPPTQWITRAMVTLRIGLWGLSAGRGPLSDGDAMADGDLLGADQDVFDEQPQHALALFDAGGAGLAAQLGEEAFQVVGELEVALTVS